MGQQSRGVLHGVSAQWMTRKERERGQVSGLIREGLRKGPELSVGDKVKRLGEVRRGEVKEQCSRRSGGFELKMKLRASGSPSKPV